MDEPAHELDAPDVSVQGGSLRMQVPMPKIIWFSVSIIEAEQYVRAADCYMTEVLFPQHGYKAGELLIKRRNKSFRSSKRGKE